MFCYKKRSKIYMNIEDVKTISSLDKCYIIIDNKIYDVTEFLEKHPTGYDIILMRAKDGVDCKNDFYFHNKESKKLIKKKFIGYVIYDD